MKHIKVFEEFGGREKQVVFTGKRNPRLVIKVLKSPDGRIKEIENETGIRFPFSVGQILNRNVEVWACNNNFLMDGKDMCLEIVFTGKRNPRLVIKVLKSPDGRIKEIENETGIRFPFSVGQILNRNVEVWACNNNFLMDGKDMCPEEKVFGIRKKDIPQGHELRMMFPGKFRN